MPPFARLTAAAVFALPAGLAAQPPAAGPTRVAALVQQQPNLPREIEAPVYPPLVIRPKLDGEPAPACDPPPPVVTDFRLSQTYLPKFGANGFGVHDTDFWVQVPVPGWEPLGKPLLLKPGFGVHAWDGPVRDQTGRAPGVPGTVYDLYLDLGWKPRPAEFLFLDFGITPGVYTDFRAVPKGAFRLRGRALAILATSERFQFVAGLLYVNRDATKVLPAGGFIWSPDEDTRLQVTFPQPKLARRVGVVGDAGWWVYLAGEFGGGTWAYRTPAGAANVLDYNDYRVIVGTELKRADGWLVRAEGGYVFGRELVPLNAPRATPGDSVMLRLAVVF